MDKDQNEVGFVSQNGLLVVRSGWNASGNSAASQPMKTRGRERAFADQLMRNHSSKHIDLQAHLNSRGPRRGDSFLYQGWGIVYPGSRIVAAFMSNRLTYLAGRDYLDLQSAFSIKVAYAT
jgi:hypothetical protein